MKAWVLHGAGDLRPEIIERPTPTEGEVLVRVKGAGICGSDIPRIYQTGAHIHPLIPGHEFSGVVEELGTGAEESWLGQRVGVFPLIPCRTCGPCRNRQYEMCRHYSYLGSRRDGGFAEYVTVPVWNLLRLPETVPFEEAAMLEPMSVAVHAMRRVMPSETDTVAVCGLGTIGMLLTMFLLEAGVRKLLLIGNKDFQRQTVQKMGISEEVYCDSRRQDVSRWLTEQTDGRGADVFFECVGRQETCALGIQSAAPLGRVMLVGNPFTDMRLPRDVYWKILRNQLTVIGTWNSTFLREPEDDWSYVLERLADKRVKPAQLITHRFSLAEMGQGFQIMREKTEDYGKIMGIV